MFEKYCEACLLDSCLKVPLRRGHTQRCRSKPLNHRCAECPMRLIIVFVETLTIPPAL
jgi:hypothetical protein